MLWVCVTWICVCYFHTWTQFNLQLSFILYPGWGAAVCQGSAVLLWLQLWGQTPLIWENWIWVTTSCRTQQWRSCVVFYRVEPVDWRLWGQTSRFIVKGLVWWHLVVKCHVAAEPPPPQKKKHKHEREPVWASVVIETQKILFFQSGLL